MWLPNIRCDIRDGKAYLAEGNREASGCHGKCSSCDSFMGVNLSDVGMRYLGAYCER